MNSKKLNSNGWFAEDQINYEQQGSRSEQTPLLRQATTNPQQGRTAGNRNSSSPLLPPGAGAGSSKAKNYYTDSADEQQGDLLRKSVRGSTSSASSGSTSSASTFCGCHISALCIVEASLIFFGVTKIVELLVNIRLMLQQNANAFYLGFFTLITPCLQTEGNQNSPRVRSVQNEDMPRVCVLLFCCFVTAGMITSLLFERVCLEKYQVPAWHVIALFAEIAYLVTQCSWNPDTLAHLNDCAYLDKFLIPVIIMVLLGFHYHLVVNEKQRRSSSSWVYRTSRNSRTGPVDLTAERAARSGSSSSSSSSYSRKQNELYDRVDITTNSNGDVILEASDPRFVVRRSSGSKNSSVNSASVERSNSKLQQQQKTTSASSASANWKFNLTVQKKSTSSSGGTTSNVGAGVQRIASTSRILTGRSSYLSAAPASSAAERYAFAAGEGTTTIGEMNASFYYPLSSSQAAAGTQKNQSMPMSSWPSFRRRQEEAFAAQKTMENVTNDRLLSQQLLSANMSEFLDVLPETTRDSFYDRMPESTGDFFTKNNIYDLNDDNKVEIPGAQMELGKNVRASMALNNSPGSAAPAGTMGSASSVSKSSPTSSKKDKKHQKKQKPPKASLERDGDFEYLQFVAKEAREEYLDETPIVSSAYYENLFDDHAEMEAVTSRGF
ncbi:unnamed protein product [Amoebophrya sp. A120]|nr:unnamed protein product [Amoebophrya sp. A120]|eukprot:GSA120T00024724001.1